MRKIVLIGNPNVGKTTLFNRLTKSDEHTGNFHGVTTDAKQKVVKFKDEELCFVDLPGLYSLRCFSFEEEVARNEILNSNNLKLVIADANSLKRNLYLCLQMSELGLQYKLLVNNCKYFYKQGNKLNINKLAQGLKTEVVEVDAKKQKLSLDLIKFNDNINQEPEYIKDFIDSMNLSPKLSRKQIILALNGVYEELDETTINQIKPFQKKIIQARYKYIEQILSDCVNLNTKLAYGESKWDKLILNPLVTTFGFLIAFFLSIYVIFFLAGPVLSNMLVDGIRSWIVNPIMNTLYMATDNVWLLEFFNSGVFSGLTTVASFLPQVCLLFMFLTVLEDSGLIARMCYVFDDLLSALGLNGKAVYIMLMGLGCNTVSTLATRNMNSKNLKIKTALINPYISCMARLPVLVLIASAFFGVKAYLVVVGLYLLGLIIACLIAVILNKTILPTKTNSLLLEFPPLKRIDAGHLVQVGKRNAIDFEKRVFGVVVAVSVIVWLLTHTKFNFAYTDVIQDSILFKIANLLSFVFKPIGLGSAGIVCALLVGVLAKELIVSTFTICNNVATTDALIASFAMPGSIISFSLPSAVSFLVFVLLYCPCVSNLAMLKKETDKFYALFSVVSQFVIAYLTSWIIYIALTNGVGFAVLAFVVIGIIVASIIYLIKKVKHNKCLTCGKCKY